MSSRGLSRRSSSVSCAACGVCAIWRISASAEIGGSTVQRARQRMSGIAQPDQRKWRQRVEPHLPGAGFEIDEAQWLPRVALAQPGHCRIDEVR